MSKQTKLAVRDRVAQILQASLDVAKTVGFNRMTREDIAERAKVSPALITYHLGTMKSLRRDVMREAIRCECLPVIAQGIVLGDPHAVKAPRELLSRALASLATGEGVR